MIYMEPATLGWEPLVLSWIPTLNSEWCEDKTQYLIDLFNWMVPPCLYYINKHCVQFCKPGDISLVKTMMNMVEMFMDDATKGSKADDITKYSEIWIQASFMQAGLFIIYCLSHFELLKNVFI